MEWLTYLLEANLYLVLFYGFYRLFLANTTFYSTNRYFLVIGTVLAFVLPVLQLGFMKPTIAFDPEILALAHSQVMVDHSALVQVTQTETPLQLSDYVYMAYFSIAGIFALKFAFGIAEIVRLWLIAKKYRKDNVTIVELNEQTTAFSFFNLLFVHPNLLEKTTVIDHEMVHIKQKHSVDILFFEMVQIISWFNPALYFLKKDIKLIHEYIADEATTSVKIEKHEYAMFLIQHSFGVLPTPLTNQIFNQSILKRRINMLNKQKTAGWTKLRLLMAIPLTGAMLCSSTLAFTKDYGYFDLFPEKSKVLMPQQEKPKKESGTKKVEPPPPKIETVRFPPPVIKNQKNGTYAYQPNFYKNQTTGLITPVESRYVVVNGVPISYNDTFYGVRNAAKITFVPIAAAIKKYGNVAKFGAIEVTGPDVKMATELPQFPVEPPPPRQKKIVKFPPPMVKKDGNASVNR